jgi:hypothetical protein
VPAPQVGADFRAEPDGSVAGKVAAAGSGPSGSVQSVPDGERSDQADVRGRAVGEFLIEPRRKAVEVFDSSGQHGGVDE